MRIFSTVLLLSAAAIGQSSTDVPQLAPGRTAPQKQAQSSAATRPDAATSEGKSQSIATVPENATEAEAPDPNAFVIPAGSRLPLTLKQAISTKNAREGDPVYAETVFPFVQNDRILVPAGTYIQGRIAHAERAGHGHGRSEILIHFTSMIFPSGYTVMLPGSIQNTPGADDKAVKDKEGTIQQDKNTGKKVEEAARNGVYGTMGGATAGGLATGALNGARVGAGIGAAAGIAWALLKRGPDVKLDVGTSIEMEIQRPITVDGSRVHFARAGS